MRKLYRFLYKHVSSVINKIDIILVKLCSNNTYLTRLYYSLFSSQFDDAMSATLNGRREFNDLMAKNQSVSILRRNVHRLEKGLIMRPRRKVFAKDYIEETVNSYIEFSHKSIDNDLQKWSESVLDEYFSVIEKDEYLLNIEEQYKKSTDHKTTQYNKKPYLRDLNNSPVSYDQLYSLSVKRRSVRWYKDIDVDKELIDKAIKIASLSPSACNRQPFSFRISNDSQSAVKLAQMAGGTAGFSHNIPMTIAVVGEMSNYFHERDKNVIYIDASLATMSFVYALETLGLSSCIINWSDIKKNNNKISKYLGLSKTERVVMLISVGWPDDTGLVPFSQKKEINELRKFG